MASVVKKGNLDVKQKGKLGSVSIYIYYLTFAAYKYNAYS